MRFLIIALFSFTVAACSSASVSSSPVEFWRPVSEPNLLMSPERAQHKLNFDLSQCRCGIFPSNIVQPDQIAFQPDKQRLVETGVTITEADSDGCMQRPSLVVAECMRARGWEVTRCSGRMPVPGGGSLCAGTVIETP